MKQDHEVFVKMPKRTPSISTKQPKSLHKSPRFLRHRNTPEPQHPKILKLLRPTPETIGFLALSQKAKNTPKNLQRN